MKDWRGVTVKVGDRVLYATRQGSSMEMVEGNVLAVESGLEARLGRGNDEQAIVEVINDSWYSFQPRKRPARVGKKYITVVTGLPEATDDTA